MFVLEGDTPTFLYLISNGLGSPEHPDWGSWGGRYLPVDRSPVLAYNHFHDATDRVVGAKGQAFRIHTSVRGLATFLVRLVYTLGPFVCALIVNDTGAATSRWAYRTVFCAQYGFAAVSAAFVFFMPESPWWLASRGHDEKAIMNLRRLGSSRDEAEQKMATIKRTLEEVRREPEGASYLEFFRKSNLRRTTIAVLFLCMLSAAGASFPASYSTYYAQTVGSNTEMSFKIQIIQQVLSLIGNVISWWLIGRVGRRQVTFWSSFVLMVFLFIIGALATEGSSEAFLPPPT
ncbi:hypothetical protein BDV30DRAFT_236840 [Aspergillus minisclerotigenes]|uniref:Cellulose-binding Sde182 nucleoside hydrolase-like domain-containing protein n=1 Tax=Aspergillus minisclerotigenes TaxID=656917 RepID=A0A5N6JA21_9EURO|nr:hypothetical protein BDV30DRAFT_236840 [Aspergillus minisclerotigenes]